MQPESGHGGESDGGNLPLDTSEVVAANSGVHVGTGTEEGALTPDDDFEAEGDAEGSDDLTPGTSRGASPTRQLGASGGDPNKIAQFFPELRPLR